MMDNVRIAILSSHEQVCAFIDNSLPKALHMYDDELHTYLKGTAATFSFKVSARHPDAAHLVVGSKVSFRHENRDWYFNIVSADQDDDEVDVVGYGASLDLVNSYTTELQINQAYSFKEYVSMADKSKSVTIGINEVSSKRVKCEWDSSSTVLARLFSIATNFYAEIELLTRLTEHYALDGITMNAYKEHSDQYQGIGQNRKDVILRNGKNIGTLRRKAEITDLYTAIWPTGKDGLTLSGIDKEEYDSDGNLEYYSPSGDPRIFAVQAMRRFPSATNRSDYKRYIEYQWSCDTDNVNTLYGQALAQLKKNCVPSVEYETECYVDAGIGDTFVIQDLEFNPPIYLQARVTEQVNSFTDYSRNKTTFDNYKELQSQLDPNLVKKMQEMVKNTVVNPVITINADTSLTITDADGEKTTPTLKGSDAEIIKLNVSSDLLNKSADGTFKTGSITANAKKRVGNGEEEEYVGRFVVAYTTDNETWIHDEGVDTAYFAFAFDTGMIEVESDLIKAIRISLYKAGGTDVLLDQVTIPVVEDGADGSNGADGASIWSASAEPAVSGSTYTFGTSGLSGSTSAPKAGDIILQSYYRYTVTEVSGSSVVCENRESMIGDEINDLINRFKFSAKIGKWGSTWAATTVWNNVGSKEAVVDNEYFSTISGADASITVKKSGKYLVHYFGQAAGATANNVFWMGLYINDTYDGDGHSAYCYSTYQISIEDTRVLELNAGDTVKLYAGKSNISGSTLNVSGKEYLEIYNL